MEFLENICEEVTVVETGAVIAHSIEHLDLDSLGDFGHIGDSLDD